MVHRTYNPIEYVNNELKRYIKEKTINTEEQLRTIIEKFMKECSKKGMSKYYKKHMKNLVFKFIHLITMTN